MSKVSSNIVFEAGTIRKAGKEETERDARSIKAAYSSSAAETSCHWRTTYPPCWMSTAGSSAKRRMIPTFLESLTLIWLWLARNHWLNLEASNEEEGSAGYQCLSRSRRVELEHTARRLYAKSLEKPGVSKRGRNHLFDRGHSAMTVLIIIVA